VASGPGRDTSAGWLNELFKHYSPGFRKKLGAFSRAQLDEALSSSGVDAKDFPAQGTMQRVARHSAGTPIEATYFGDHLPWNHGTPKPPTLP